MPGTTGEPLIHFPLTETVIKDGYRVQAVDLPEIVVTGTSAEAVAAQAKAAFVAALPAYIEQNGTLPKPTPLDALKHTFVVKIPRAQLLALLKREEVPEWL